MSSELADRSWLETPLRFLKGIGPVRARQLAEAGYRTVGELLFHLPHRYEDRRHILPLAEVAEAGPTTVCGRLHDLRVVRVKRRGFSLVRGVVEDASGQLPVVWFNRPYLPSQVRPQQAYLLHGEVHRSEMGRLELVNPSTEPAAQAIHAGRIIAVYPQAGELGPTAMRRLLSAALAHVDLVHAVPDPLPAELRTRHHLPALGQALADLHLPGEGVDVELLNERRSAAHQRLIYGELLDLELALSDRRAEQRGRQKRHRYAIDDPLREVARAVLPFRLTAAQRRALREIAEDLQRPQPMLRLLQGDVGSGKTIVAALAIVLAVENGLQAAFMAPTELLAEQHHRGLARLLGGRYRLALVSGRTAAESAALRADLAAGSIQVAVGTHALIQGAVAFERLGLAIIDEQHRFGVVQRQLLQAKGDRPDLLVMTATPIPRSLALASYGDLDVSVLDELPPGRHPVATELKPESRRREVYRQLRADLATGARGYVVFPLIEASERVAAASVEEQGEEVRSELGEFASAVVHGQLPAEERQRALAAFAAGTVQVLIATTVIEVGIDVPEATVIVIEGAERFGLAQLHQLRGRVGRSERPSRCVALHGRLSVQGRERLRVFAGTNDGFAIAEADLRIRGPGDLLGTRQAGLPTLRVAHLEADIEWLERAAADARQLQPRLGEPAYRELRRRLDRLLGERAAPGLD